METMVLTEAAELLLELHLGGGSLRMGVKAPETLPGLTVDRTRAAYRELVAAGLMIPLHTFAHGRDSRYRLTEARVRFSPNRHASP